MEQSLLEKLDEAQANLLLAYTIACGLEARVKEGNLDDEAKEAISAFAQQYAGDALAELFAKGGESTVAIANFLGSDLLRFMVELSEVVHAEEDSRPLTASLIKETAAKIGIKLLA